MHFLSFTHGLRRGLYSFAASRLIRLVIGNRALSKRQFFYCVSDSALSEKRN
jgi:hypothetical protein